MFQNENTPCWTLIEYSWVGTWVPSRNLDMYKLKETRLGMRGRVISTKYIVTKGRVCTYPTYTSTRFSKWTGEENRFIYVYIFTRIDPVIKLLFPINSITLRSQIFCFPLCKHFVIFFFLLHNNLKNQ